MPDELPLLPGFIEASSGSRRRGEPQGAVDRGGEADAKGDEEAGPPETEGVVGPAKAALEAAIAQAFAAGPVVGEEGAACAPGRAELLLAVRAEPVPAPGIARLAVPAEIPARMLNEFVYCPRLFYYEFVEGVFVENADTRGGSAIHKKVDSGRGDLPAARAGKAGVKKKPKAGEEAGRPGEEGAGKLLLPGSAADSSSDVSSAPAEAGAPENPQSEIPNPQSPETIHSRSVQMGSARLGVVAKMDLVESRAGVGPGGQRDLFAAVEVCPVDYKVGSPRQGAEGIELWDADRMQLGLQALILRDNGYTCTEGVIYYRGTRQRVRLPISPELEAWVLERIAGARACAAGPMPPPLAHSPKCPRCSLAPVCLPDETRMLRQPVAEAAEEAPPPAPVVPPRRLMAARSDLRALYLSTPGLRVGRKGETLEVKQEDRVIDTVRLLDVDHVGLFGNIQLSTQAIQALCEAEIPVTYFSMGGWFYGHTRGHGLKNVFLRLKQFQTATDPAACLRVARAIVRGKIRNQRTLLMRNHIDPPAPALARLKEAAAGVHQAGSLPELLGMEGAAAAVYFQHFSGMVKHEAPDQIPGLEVGGESEAAAAFFRFDFDGRNRRPPRDPVNACLSLASSLLAKDCHLAALTVGFDPYVGFYHQPRFGRPALALDLMEEFRPLIADSVVLTAINNGVLAPSDFVRAGDAVNLSPAGRKRFFQIYEQRLASLLTHPVFDYKVSYRRALELQARLLARTLTGEIPEYIPLMTR